MKRTAFTMIELVFVIVILGILSAIAIPKFAATRDDAQIAKGRSDVAAIRAAIVSERQGRLMQGQSNYITALDHGSTTLFDDNDSVATNGTLLQYGIAAGTGNGKWAKTGDNAYTYTILGVAVPFTYTPATGVFNCSGTYCDKLTN
ncbi:MAG TPA: prepilin-type N-terminal cleavage/methylation domain-containing protein [Sulfuricurvum sp.]|nr:prepilin-type N-terminal cleavage/methylation domain-containing protein [Sulfuricurvum sp.]